MGLGGLVDEASWLGSSTRVVTSSCHDEQFLLLDLKDSTFLEYIFSLFKSLCVIYIGTIEVFILNPNSHSSKLSRSGMIFEIMRDYWKARALTGRVESSRVESSSCDYKPKRDLLPIVLSGLADDSSFRPGIRRDETRPR
jgi:hypothetical protein